VVVKTETKEEEWSDKQNSVFRGEMWTQIAAISHLEAYKTFSNSSSTNYVRVSAPLSCIPRRAGAGLPLSVAELYCVPLNEHRTRVMQ